MRTRTGISWLGIFSALCLLAAVILTAVELFGYSRLFPTLPPGLSIGGVPVGGLTEAAARTQLETAYGTPVELQYQGSQLWLDPKEVGFTLNMDSMLTEAASYRTSENFWGGFWDYLWLRPRTFNAIPLSAAVAPEKLRSYLADVAARYDRPGSAPQADVGSLGFVAGELGHTLDEEAAYRQVEAALQSPAPEARVVVLPVSQQNAVRPSLGTLRELIRQDALQFQFSGLISLYLYDLENGQELQLDLWQGVEVTGPVAYSAMSTIKIPIMVAFFGQKTGELTEDEQLLLTRSLDTSANTATDLLMKVIGVGDALEGTRSVVAMLNRLGLVNTYISGLLDVSGAVLSPRSTPANSRLDINTLPDPYNQTTAEDMGMLLTMIYQCSQNGGALLAAFPGQYTPEECRTMIDLLTQNAVGPIFIAGGSTPDGVVAHKHGWDRVPLTNAADAALVFTPSSKYTLAIYLNQPATMEFDQANRLIISLARAVHAYFSPVSAPPPP